MAERDLMWKWIEALPFAVPGSRPFRRNIVNVEAIGGWRAVAGIKGQCDVQVMLKGGRVVEVETKARRGKLEPKQEVWRDFCLAWEIPWMCLIEKKGETPDATVLRWIEEFRAIYQGLPATITFPLVRAR